jgi:hypothetical protein
MAAANARICVAITRSSKRQLDPSTCAIRVKVKQAGLRLDAPDLPRRS